MGYIFGKLSLVAQQFLGEYNARVQFRMGRTMCVTNLHADEMAGLATGIFATVYIRDIWSPICHNTTLLY